MMTQSDQSPTLEKFNSEEQLKNFLVEDALEKYSNQFGKEAFSWWNFDIDLDKTIDITANADVDVSGNFGSVAFDSAVSSPSFSETNTQEQGVDEADLVETNGEFIYQVTGETLTIVDARNSDQLSITSETDLKDLGNIEGAYLYNDQLTVISTVSPWSFWSGGFDLYGNTTFPTPKVNVTILDVSDPASVEIEETSSLDGNLLSSRAIEDQVYVVTQGSFGLPGPEQKFVQNDPPVKPDPIDVPEKEVTIDLPEGVTIDLDKGVSIDVSTDFTTDGLTEVSGSISTSSSDGVTEVSGSVNTDSFDFVIDPWFPKSTYRYETEEEYLERIEGQELELALPEFTTVDDQGNVLREGLLSEAQDTYKPLDDNPFNVASVSAFDVDDDQPGPNSSTSVPTDSLGELYMSLDNLYLLENNWWQGGQTGLLKMDLDSLDFVATGEVPGRVLDQFSVDEEEGFLRVATTTRSGGTPENNVYVLEQEGQHLETVGSVEGIAPGETIHSARFEGDYGFMVTFRQVDPFFTLDLSEPTNPEVVGELKLPGFSEYLQVIENTDKTQVLGIGRESNRLKVSLFDATDFDDPEEVDSYLFDRYSSSEAQWDAQAVGYYPEFDTLAIPFQSSGERGLRVFDVDEEEGFTEIGDITHDGERIRRSLVIDDDLYAISSDRVTVHDIETLELVDEIILPEESTNTGYPILKEDPVWLGGSSIEIGASFSGSTIDSFSI